MPVRFRPAAFGFEGFALVAQLVEQRTENPRVVGSIPTGGTTFGERHKNADVAHLVERHLAKVEVAGSSPVIRSKEKRLIFRCFFPFVTKIFFVYIIHCKRFRRHSQGVRHESAKL